MTSRLKQSLVFITLVAVMLACSTQPSESIIQTASAQTMFAQPSITYTHQLPTELPTRTSTITNTPTITPTPTITFTPSVTPTPTKSLTPTPTFPAIQGADCIPNDNRTYAKVTRVIDGDTIEVNIEGSVFKVRYIGMDTPENTTQVEYYGPEATYKNRLLVEGKTVILFRDVSETDKYNRLLRYVIADSIFVNYELVRTGYAQVLTYPPDVSCQSTFSAAQTIARDNQLGFWKPTPVPSYGGGGESGTGSGTGNCDPSYPTVCIPPPPPDLDCKDISYRNFTVIGSDPHRFDGDKDGIGCEQ